MEIISGYHNNKILHFSSKIMINNNTFFHLKYLFMIVNGLEGI